MTQGSTTPLTGPASAVGPAAATAAAAAIAAPAAAPPRRTTGGGRPGGRAVETLGLYALLAPTFILLAIFSLVPFAVAFLTSFYDYEIGGDSRFVGLANYREYLRDDTFGESFRNMLLLTAIHVVAVIVVPLTVAKLIFSLRSERASYFYRILFLLPIVVPNVAVYLIWQGLIYSEGGLVNALLERLGMNGLARGWFSDPPTALLAIACIGFPFAGGINILIYYAGLTSIPDSVHEAAMLDGATGLRKFLLIDVPMVMSQIKLLVMLTIIGGIQSFEAIYILTKGGPGFKTMVPGLWMYLNAFMFQRMGYACAIGVTLFLLILTLTVINMRVMKTSEELQGS
ncbi:MAG TPA: sugar ABC transporter permease [Tepidisphaeraceae bacterium]|nr:sugar ABC transporter permease [Tepidisphaeraceae bacterium]